MLLGDIMSGWPRLLIIERPGQNCWWMERPIVGLAQEELAFRRVRKGCYVAVLST